MVADQWLSRLIAADANNEFFKVCTCNGSWTAWSLVSLFDLNAARTLCWRCVGHEHAQLLQVRRSATGHALVKVAEMESLMDISGVQTYQLNHLTAVYITPHELQHRPIVGQPRCMVDHRLLLDAKFRYCSIRCKALAGIPVTALAGSTTGYILRSKGDALAPAPTGAVAMAKVRRRGVPRRTIAVHQGRLHKRKGIPVRSFFE
jgi:hypothetical protein